MTLQERPRFNGAGAMGRRMTELDESTAVAKAYLPVKGPVSRGARLFEQADKKASGFRRPTSNRAARPDLARRTSDVMVRRSDRTYRESVGKARHFDPEHRRQRRIGMGEAALLGAGGVLGFRGVSGAVKATKQARKVTWAAGKPGQKELEGALRRGVALRRRDLAQIGGGLSGVTGAAALRQHAETRRGRAYE